MKTADIAALIMDSGIANLFFIKNNTTLLKSFVKKSIPKKRSGSNKRDKAVESFYYSVMVMIGQHLDFD